MKIIEANLRSNFVEALAGRRRSGAYALELPTRKIANELDVLVACFDVYNSGIIFPQGGARAKRQGTPDDDEALVNLSDKIYAYLMNAENASISQSEFDAFHADCCEGFLNEINPSRASVGYVPLCYGSAQKLTNMIFKYLACYEDYESFAEHFKWCHMPIDTVMLRWLKDRYQIGDIRYRVSTNSKGNEMLSAKYKGKSWTSFDSDLYRELLAVIREKLAADPEFEDCSVLGAEFAAWL